MQSSSSNKKLREFGYLIGIGFPLMIGWIIPFIAGHTFKVWTAWIGIPILLIGILFPSKLNILYKGWMSLGHVLGWINSKIILGLVFILILQPIALFMRLFGYDPMRIRKKIVDSYREKKINSTFDLTKTF